MLFDAPFTEGSFRKALHSGRFSRPCFVADVLGFLTASYAIGLVGYVINNTSHTPSRFSHASVFLLTAGFIVFCYMISRKFGNTRYFGLKTVLATTVTGSLSVAVLASIIGAVLHGPSVLADSGLGLVGSIFFTVVAFPTAMIVRLIATPIVKIFEPTEPFNIPHS